MALFEFNVGIEIGQLLFDAAVLSVGRLVLVIVPRLPVWARSAAGGGTGSGSVASFWVFARLAAGV